MKRKKTWRRLLVWILVFALMSGMVSCADETDDGDISISYSDETDDGDISISYPDETDDGDISISYSDETDDNYTMYLTQVKSGDITRTENILKDADGVFYFTTAAIERYTGYTFNEEKMVFRKYEDTVSTDKQIWVSPETGQVTIAMMETSYPIEGLDFPQYQGTWWFPIYVFLPIMEQLSYVEDGVLVIEGLQVTLEDALHDLDMDSLMFDPESEFAGMAWANSLMVGSAYLFDTFGKLNLERLTSMGTVADYETVFTDYLTDRDAYEIAYGEDSLLSDILDTTDTVHSIAKEYKLSVKSLKALRGIAESIQMKVADGELLFEEDYFATDAFDEIIPKWLFEGMSSVSDVLSLASTAYEIAQNYATMVLDNREALAAVYPDIVGGYESSGVHIFADSSSSELIQEAVSNVYAAYTDDSLSNVFWGIYEAVVEELEDELWSNLEKLAFKFALKLPGYYSAAAAVEKEALDVMFKKIGITASDDMALLNHHITVLENAKEAYTASKHQSCTQDNLQTLRRTAILTLLSSKKCFEIMRDNNTTYDEFVSYCDTKIENIEEQLALLYLAGESVAMDGIEYFRSASFVLKYELPELQVTDTIPEMKTWQNIYAQLSLSSGGTAYTYMEDLTGDGVVEMIVADYSENREVSTLTVYTLQDQTPVQIYEIVGSRAHAGWRFICLAKDSVGQAGILVIMDSEWQGYKSCAYCFYTFSADGTQTVSDAESWDDNGETGLGEEQIEYIGARFDDLTIILNTQYEILPEGSSTIEDLCGYLSDFGITATDVSGKLQEAIYSEGLSKDYVEEELAAWLGTDFNNFSLYEETDEYFTYRNDETAWFITVYRLSGKVEYCDYRGVILDEMQIDGNNDNFSEYRDEYEAYYGIEEEDDSYVEYITDCLLSHYWATTLSDGTYLELSFSGTSLDLTMGVFVDIMTYSVPCRIDTGSGMDVYIDDGMALLEYLPILYNAGPEYTLAIDMETLNLYLSLNDSTIVIPAA